MRAGHDEDLDAAACAAAALDHARDDPGRAVQEARRALRLAAMEGDATAAVVAERALGLAARADHDLAGSLRHLRRAVRTAERHGLTAAAGQSRVSLFGTLALRGQFSAALREAERAAAEVRGVDRARLELQRATVLLLQARLDEAAECLRKALPPLRRAGETSLEATVLENRGLVHCYRGAMAAAESDLRRALELRRQLGQPRLAAIVQQNLGFVAARRGDVPAALAWFDGADTYFEDHGLVDPVGLHDRCAVLLHARLATEARAVAERAIEVMTQRDMAAYLGEARVMLAEAALLEGDPATARQAAREAAGAFVRQQRHRHRALAEYLACKAEWLAGERSARLLAAARRSARALDGFGWLAPAQDARLIAGRLALERDQRLVARREFEAAGRLRNRGPLPTRVRAWHAEALRRLQDGNRAGAARALDAGIALVERHRALLGATELRAHASGHAAELAELGLHLALEGRSAERVLLWAERWRAGSLFAAPRPSGSEPHLDELLAQLRHITAQVERQVLEGGPTRQLRRRQAQLERSVQQLARRAAGGGAQRAQRVDRRALAGLLDGWALVELVESGGHLHAVTLTERACRLTPLAPAAEVLQELEWLRFAIRRLAHQRAPAASQAAAHAAFEHGRKRLDELLMAPLAGQLCDRPVVLVPTGPLHALPWAALPSCAGRPVTVAPSARLWQRTASAGATPAAGPTVLVTGPDVAWAEAEIAALRERYPQALCLVGPDATVPAVTAALDGADLAHLVAHGRFRTDNPLFSSLRLADGALTVYDLEKLHRAPRRLVLSACDSGLSQVRPGDELQGLVASLFGTGTSTVVASVVPVPDQATHGLMVAMHAALAEGDPPAAALARAQTATVGSWTEVAAAVGFVCFGAA